jgi:hypothetical protein
MGHLTTEALARLVDGVPTAEEQKHLDACAGCAQELEALNAQTEGLASLPALRPPRGDWEALEARLIAEGLIRPEEGGQTIPLRARRGWYPAAQAAAAVLLFLGGTFMGSAMGPTAETGNGSVGNPGIGELSAMDYSSPAALTTMDEAAEAVRVAEQNYINAMIRYRQLVEASGRGLPQAEDPANRYAALEAVMAASQAAVREAPTDPFLNGILASVMAERQAYQQTLAQGNDSNWY